MTKLFVVISSLLALVVGEGRQKYTIQLLMIDVKFLKISMYNVCKKREYCSELISTVAVVI